MNTHSILQNIYNQHGALTPELLVQEATPDTHPLHTHFEWDDTKAGKRYRELQAAQIIRSVKVTYQETPRKEVRAFVNVKRDPTDELGLRSSYEPVDLALSNELTRRRLFDEMKRDWLTFKAKYSHMTEYADLLRAEANGEDIEQLEIAS